MPGMELVAEPRGAIDLTVVPVHLGLGARARAVEGFGWDGGAMAAYAEAVAGDGAEGRLVMVFECSRSWDAWERHPAGEEVVICLSGRMTLTQEVDGRHEQWCSDRTRRSSTRAACGTRRMWTSRPGSWRSR